MGMVTGDVCICVAQVSDLIEARDCAINDLDKTKANLAAAEQVRRAMGVHARVFILCSVSSPITNERGISRHYSVCSSMHQHASARAIMPLCAHYTHESPACTTQRETITIPSLVGLH